MARIYDSSDMQRVINMLHESIQALQNAHKRMKAISLNGLSGNTRDAIQRQVDEKSETIQALVKTLNAAISSIAAKQSVLK